jgi:hypothetical protein
MDADTLPKQARYQLRYTRLLSFLSGWSYSPKYALQYIITTTRALQDLFLADAAREKLLPWTQGYVIMETVMGLENWGNPI